MVSIKMIDDMVATLKDEQTDDDSTSEGCNETLPKGDVAAGGESGCLAPMRCRTQGVYPEIHEAFIA